MKFNTVSDVISEQDAEVSKAFGNKEQTSAT